MRIFLYGVALILVIAWGIGFIGFALGGIIHILLVLAATAVIFGLSRTSTKE